MVVSRRAAGPPVPRVPVGYLLPVLLILGGVLVGPSLYTLVLSFQSYNLFSGQTTFVGLANFQRLLADPLFWKATTNTLIYTGGASVIEFALGLGIALLLHRPRPGARLVRAVVIAPWALSAVVVGLSWRVMFHPNYGIVNYVLSLVGIPFGAIPWLADPTAAMVAVIVADVWQNTPFVTLLLLAALQVLPHEPYEAAAVDGASRWQTFRYLTLPLLRPAILAVMMFRVIFAFREFTIPWTMTSGGPANGTLLLSMYLYQRLLQFREVGLASAVGWVMLLLTVLITFLLLRRLDDQA